MKSIRTFGVMALALSIGFAMTLALAQGNRGKAELKVGSNSITVDYGRPVLKGRDMLSKLAVGDTWRMGMNQASVMTTPVDLMFGSTKIDAGSYSLWLKKVSDTQYELVFNSRTGQWGTQHDEAKDVAKASMKMTSLSSPVETFTIELKPSTGGGEFVLQWGTAELSAAFTAK